MKGNGSKNSAPQQQPPRSYIRTGLLLPPKNEPFLPKEWYDKPVWENGVKLIGRDFSSFKYTFNMDFVGTANKTGPQEHKTVKQLSGSYTAAMKIDTNNHPLDKDGELKFEYCVVSTNEGGPRSQHAYCEYE
jgi:hypothetical protein